jgi:hypothetical protein
MSGSCFFEWTGQSSVESLRLIMALKFKYAAKTEIPAEHLPLAPSGGEGARRAGEEVSRESLCLSAQRDEFHLV